MTTQSRTILLLVLAAVILVGGLTLYMGAPVLPTVISVLALLISLISAFKNELLPFELKVLAGDVLVAAPTSPSHASLPLVFPISFLNTGYAGGIVEAIAIKVIDDQGNVKLYTPIAEIDFMQFIQGRRQLHADNIAGTFSAFPIHAKQSLKKHILFSQEEKSAKYPFNQWKPGKHKFELYLKASQWRKPKKLSQFECEINAKVLSEYARGTSTHIASHKIDI